MRPDVTDYRVSRVCIPIFKVTYENKLLVTGLVTSLQMYVI
jgi:hypothetical protein